MKLAEGTFVGLHETEVALFQKHLKGVSGIGVEIGCCDGFSSAVILEASELHLTSIDPFIPDSMEPSLIGSIERYRENVVPFGVRSHLIVDYSFNVSNMGVSATLGYFKRLDPRAPIDFLFIDGNHEYQMVKLDFDEWTPTIKPGGILAMHDARMGREGSPSFHDGPSRVAREHVFARPDEWLILGEAFTLVIAQKL